MSTFKHVTIEKPKGGKIEIGNDLPLVILAGPCQMESREHALFMAEALAGIRDRLGVEIIFKASYDKANRTSAKGVRGVGMDAAMPVFEEIKEKFNFPTLTDVHSIEQCAPVAKVVDCLQIPAFLCRQTDLLVEAAKTGRVINIKKGQFLAPWDMKNVAEKVSSAGNDRIILCERGASFGYNTLVADMRSLPIMAETGHPIMFDVTHAVQQPGGNGTCSGGDRRYAPVLARAATAVGLAMLYFETHQDPDHAPSDGPNMVRLSDFEPLIKELMAYDKLSKARVA